eukprot:19708-Heterococcus_DN1.PRE.1
MVQQLTGALRTLQQSTLSKSCYYSASADTTASKDVLEQMCDSINDNQYSSARLISQDATARVHTSEVQWQCIRVIVTVRHTVYAVRHHVFAQRETALVLRVSLLGVAQFTAPPIQTYVTTNTHCSRMQ